MGSQILQETELGEDGLGRATRTNPTPWTILTFTWSVEQKTGKEKEWKKDLLKKEEWLRIKREMDEHFLQYFSSRSLSRPRSTASKGVGPNVNPNEGWIVFSRRWERPKQRKSKSHENCFLNSGVEIKRNRKVDLSLKTTSGSLLFVTHFFLQYKVTPASTRLTKLSSNKR